MGLKEDLQWMVKEPKIIELLNKFGLKTDLSFESLRFMENKINEIYPVGMQASDRINIFLGVYVGNVIIEHVPGAKWNFEDVKSAFEIKVSVPMQDGYTFEFFPVSQMYRFWNDRTNSIFDYAEMIIIMSEGKINLHHHVN